MAGDRLEVVYSPFRDWPDFCGQLIFRMLPVSFTHTSSRSSCSIPKEWQIPCFLSVISYKHGSLYKNSLQHRVTCELFIKLSFSFLCGCHDCSFSNGCHVSRYWATPDLVISSNILPISKKKNCKARTQTLCKNLKSHLINMTGILKSQLHIFKL